MAKDPAFLFYSNDFMSGTQFFSDEQVGKYIRILIAQHQLGHLDEKHMLFICKSYDKDIFQKFSKDSDGLYYNERLENEIVKRKEYALSRAKNRNSKKNISSSYVKHMEDEDENRNKYAVNANVLNRQNVFEYLRRATPKSLSDARIEDEVNKFLNYYSGEELKNIGSACNNWAANIKTDEKKMVL